MAVRRGGKILVTADRRFRHEGPRNPGDRFWTQESHARELARKGLVHFAGVRRNEVRSSKDTWPLKIDPKTYLTRFPEGPQAELAKKIVAAEGE